MQRYLKGAYNLLNLWFRRHRWRFHPARWTDTSHIPLQNPVFLLGVQGGGLTLLARMLRRHTDMVSVTGNHTYWAGPDEMQNVMGSILPAELTGLYHKVPPYNKHRIRNWVYATDDLLPLYRQTAVSATPQIQRSFHKAIRLSLAQHALKPQQARFIDKSQTFTVRLSLVQALLEKQSPYFILVTRNPYAVCYRSAIKVKALNELDLSFEKKLRLAAEHWGNSFRCVLEDKPQVANFMHVRFEDILQEPEQQVQEICQFLRLSFQPSMIPQAEHTFPIGASGSAQGDHKWYPLRTDVNQRSLEALEPWMIEIIDEQIGDLAKRWHYTPIGP